MEVVSGLRMRVECARQADFDAARVGAVDNFGEGWLGSGLRGGLGGGRSVAVGVGIGVRGKVHSVVRWWGLS